MKHILKILSLVAAICAFWIGLLETSVIPRSCAWLLPVYFVISLGCYGLLMVGIGLMLFPTCPEEAVLLQKDIAEAKEFLKERGVDPKVTNPLEAMIPWAQQLLAGYKSCPQGGPPSGTAI